MDPQQKQPIKTIFDQFYTQLEGLSLYQQLGKDIHSTLIYTPKDKYKQLDQIFTIDLKLNNFFKNPLPRQLTKCQNKLIDKVYICYDCQLVKDGFLCQECFNNVQHKKSCRYVVKQLSKNLSGIFSCSCGDYNRINYRGTCHNHHQLLYKLPKLNNQQKIEQLTLHLVGCFKMSILCSVILQNLQKDNSSSQKFFDLLIFIKRNYILKLFETLIEVNKNSTQFLYAIQKSLLVVFNTNQLKKYQQNVNKIKYMKENLTILGAFINIITNESIFYILIKSILQLQNQQLIKDFIQNILASPNNFDRSYKITGIKDIIQSLRIQPKLLCKIFCEQTEKGLFEKCQLFQTLQLYSLAVKPDLALNYDQKAYLTLVSCWKYIQKQNNLTIQNIIKLNKLRNVSMLNFLSFMIYDDILLASVMKKFIIYVNQKVRSKYITKNPTGNKINLAELCNILSKVIYMFGKGDLIKIADFLYSLNVNSELCEVIYYYFYESFEFITHLSPLSVSIYGIYLNYVKKSDIQIYEKQYSSPWINVKFQHQKLFDHVAKFLNFVVGQQLKTLSKISSVSQITQQQRNKIQQIQQQKFKQLLYMQKQLPKYQMDKIIKQNILNFKYSTEILKKYTKYDKKSNSFIYNSQQNYFSFDGIVNNIFSLQQAQKLVFNPQKQDHSFDQKFRKQIFLGILGPILQREQIYYKQCDVKKFNIIKKNPQFTKYTCLVIIDKILNGEIKQLRNYLLTIKKELFNNKITQNENRSLDIIKKIRKLFGLDQLNPEKICIIQQQPIKMEKIESVLTQSNNQVKKQQNNINLIPNTSIAQQTPKKQKVQHQKLKRLRQKMNQKRQSFLSSLKQSPIPAKIRQNVETCMICKQEPHNDNALFYLGVLKKQAQDNQIFSSRLSIEYSANLCMHLIHQKCFTTLCKGNSMICPLCKVNSNVAFPYQNQMIGQKTRQFMQNRLTYTFVNAFNQYHPGKCFIFLLKNLVSQILFYTLFNVIFSADPSVNITAVSKVQFRKKIDYYINLLKQWWDGFLNSQKQYYCQLLTQQFKLTNQLKNVNNLMQQQQNNPKNLIDQILISVICQKIMKRNNKQILNQLNKLEQLISETQFNQLVKYIEQSLGFSLQYESKLQIHNKLNKKFISYYFIPPESIPILQCITKKCTKCDKIQNSIYFCLLCNKSICSLCPHDKNHGNIKLRIDPNSGKIQGTDRKSKNYSYNVYVNTFMSGWGTNTYPWDDYFDYQVSYDIVYQCLYEWLTGMRNC